MTTKISSNHEQQSPSKHHNNHDNKSDMTLSSTIVPETMIDGIENFQSGKPTELVLQSSNHLECSMTSSYADTPGDSGVLCLDSETSDLTTASQTLMTQSLAEAEEIGCDVMNQSQLSQESSNSLMTKSDIDNQNIAQISINAHVPEILTNNIDCRPSPSFDNLPDVVLKALEVEKESTGNICLSEVGPASGVYGIAPCNEPKKSSSDDIVYRRRCKKRNQSNPNAPKKRVSFHEDILNNTKTDNIHIEHGFVSYRDSNVYTQCERLRNRIAIPDRYSWCATSDCSPKAKRYTPQQTMSDLLCYGGTEVKDCPDNTGIFEYSNTVQDTTNETVPADTYDITDNSRSDSYEENAPGDNANMYMCDSNSSDSNLSCDSETSSSDSSSSSSNKASDESQQSNKCDKTQKSYSCDCFEDNAGKPLIKTMYFSEADIDQSGNECEQDMFLMNSLPSHTNVKSVLKKKRYIPTQVVEEHSSKKQKNRKGLSLMDTQNLFASLKSIYKNFSFGLGPAEKGLPEGDEDCHSVMEAMPIETKTKTPFLSKSFDSGFHNEESDFVEINLKERNRNHTDNQVDKKNIHNVENPLRYKCNKEEATKDITAPTTNEISRQQLTLNMKADCGKPFLNWRSQNDLADNKETLPERNKYVVNCESTVYEHKGVSYCYVHDSFQTTFDTPRDTFVPLADKIQDKITSSTGSQIVSNTEPDKDTPEKIPDKKWTTDKLSDSSEKRNASCERVMSDGSDNKTGISKHLASPKKQNVKRYEKRLSYIRKATEEIPDTLSDLSCNRENVDPGYSNNILDMDDNIDLVNNSDNMLMRNSQKSTIINKYLRSIRQKKALEAKLQNNVFFQRKLREEERIFPDIHYNSKNVSDTFRQSTRKMNNLIDKEVIENRRLSVRLITADEPSYFDSFEDNVAMECSEKLRLEVFIEPTEILHRMLKVRSPYDTSDGQWGPELVFITDRALYVADVTNGQKHYNLLWHLPHDKLDSIIMGADGQYVGVCSVYGSVRWIVPGEGIMASRLGASLAWSARHNPIPPALQPRRRRPLARALARAMQLQQTEGVMFYGQVCVVGTESTTEQSEGTGAPYGPPFEGYLMYRTEGQRHWQPGYFLLKSGVVYYGAQSPGNVASHYIKLDSVLGVRRCWVGSRPHCFELAGTTRLLLAAPDDHTASMWLQALLMHAAQALVQPSENGVCVRPGLPPACSLVLTPTSIVTLREDISTDKPGKVEVLSCGSIRNLTAFKIPPNEENWCCMEWSVCEAREPGSELAVVFGSAAELERFIAAMELVWHATNSGVFPVSVSQVPRCSKVHKRYSDAWSHMLPTQH